MSTPYLGQIYLFAGNFAPRNYAYCAGQLLAISQNTALFSLLGTFYGGNGTTNFALPDLRGRVGLNQGQGPGLSLYSIGEQLGSEAVTITSQTTPAHQHNMHVTNVTPQTANPSGKLLSQIAAPFTGYYVDNANKTGSPITMNPISLSLEGGSQPHNNIQQILAISVVIALQGVFPARN